MSTNDQDPKTPETAASPERDDARRRLLKTLAAGGVAGAALPTQWTKPVIEAVVLPAHAQATSGTVVGGGGGGGAQGPGPAPGSVSESILNFFVSPAQATSLSAYCIEISVTHSGGTPSSVAVTRVQHPCPKSGLGDVPVTGGTLSGSGTNWSGTVSGFTLNLTNVSPLGAVLANAVYGSLGGVINNGVTCGPSACVLAGP